MCCPRLGFALRPFRVAISGSSILDLPRMCMFLKGWAMRGVGNGQHHHGLRYEGHSPDGLGQWIRLVESSLLSGATDQRGESIEALMRDWEVLTTIEAACTGPCIGAHQVRSPDRTSTPRKRTSLCCLPSVLCLPPYHQSPPHSTHLRPQPTPISTVILVSSHSLRSLLGYHILIALPL
jgi:hypothetical protein